MQSDIDAQLTNFFEEAPPREFATVMRGYDRHQVDEHIRQIETEVRTHRDQTTTLKRELSEAHRQIQEQERPTYSGLGARIEQLLQPALGGLRVLQFGRDFGQGGPIKPRPAIVTINAFRLVLALTLWTN